MVTDNAKNMMLAGADGPTCEFGVGKGFEAGQGLRACGETEEVREALDILTEDDMTLIKRSSI